MKSCVLYRAIILLLVALIWPNSILPPTARSQAEADNLYVDQRIEVSHCGNYDPALRSCGGGSESAYDTFDGAAAVAQPGNTIFIREDTYNEQLSPQNSGIEGSPITYRNYLNEIVTITGSFYPAAIILDNVNYIVIQGLTVADSRWLEATEAHYNTICNNTFLQTPATGTTGNVRFISSDHNHIEGNTLDTGNDNLLLIDSDHNLVEGNTIREGRHSIFGIRCGNYNILRNNYFSNSLQKIGEVYDCGEDTNAVPHAFDAAHHNLIEHNIFADTDTYYSTSGGNGIQYAGQDGIIRYNVFYNTNVGLGMQNYSDEARYNHNNRVTHNVFYNNDCAGLSVKGDNVGNVYKNNILYANKGVGGGDGDCFGEGSAQILYRSPMQGFYFEHNNLFNQTPGENVIQQEFGTGHPLVYFEEHYPELFSDNQELEPGFNNVENYDFTLQHTSPMVDEGTFLAHTLSKGSGVTLIVNDARYFHDGFEIDDVEGDVIQLEGQTQTAIVDEVNYDTNTLILKSPLDWEAGQGVSLAYEGTAPDLGAHELTKGLVLQSIPGNQTIHLKWSIDASLSPTTTWTISYKGTPGEPASPITGLSEATREYTLTELNNYELYTITLTTVGETPILSDTVQTMPTDQSVYLPLVLR